MAKLITIKVSPRATYFLLKTMTAYVHEQIKNKDNLEYQDGLSDLIAELRTIQKLKTAFDIHYAECDCCE